MSAWETASKNLQGKVAFRDSTGNDFSALCDAADTQEAIDLITLQQRLKDKQLLEQVGGLAYLSPLPDAVPSAANLSYYLDIIQEKYLLRKMIHTCTDVVGRVYDYEGKGCAHGRGRARHLHISEARCRTGSNNIKDPLSSGHQPRSRIFINGRSTTGMDGLYGFDEMTDASRIRGK